MLLFNKSITEYIFIFFLQWLAMVTMSYILKEVGKVIVFHLSLASRSSEIPALYSTAEITPVTSSLKLFPQAVDLQYTNSNAIGLKSHLFLVQYDNTCNDTFRDSFIVSLCPAYYM